MRSYFPQYRHVLSTLVIAIGAASLFVGCRASKYGIQAHEAGDYVKARQFLYESYYQEPDMRETVVPLYIDSVTKIADGFVQQGKYEPALKILDEAKGIARDNTELRKCTIRLHLSLAELCLREANLEQARKSVIEVLRLEPSNAEGRRLKGRIEIRLAQRDMALGKPTDALTRYNDYLRSYPDDREIREEVAKIYIDRGDQMVARRQPRDSLTEYATALIYLPGSKPIIDRALRAADSAGGSISNNYLYLLKQCPKDSKLRLAVGEQLRRRSMDSLENGEVDQSLEMICASYKIDPNVDANLEIYVDLVDKIVKHLDLRGETQLAARELRDAAREMPKLAKRFEERAENLIEAENAFFLQLDDHLALITRIHSDVRVAIKLDKKMTSEQRRRAEAMLDFLHQQKESLTNVRRHRNRQLLSRRSFDIPYDTVEVLYQILGKQQYDEYRNLLEYHLGER